MAEVTTEMNKIGSYDFIAEQFHVDFNGRLALGILGNQCLNCAGFHAAERDFGATSVNETNYVWVLSRLVIELDDMPNRYEKFTIRTWVEDVYRLFTNRNFAFVNKDGRTIGYARSIWAMINADTRKPADLLSIHGENISDYICDESCPIEKPSRIKVNTQNASLTTLTVKYSDIDINGHVNSIRYIEHILDLFPIEIYKTMHVHRSEIAYIIESYYGDELTFFKEETGSNEYSIEVKKNTGEITCRAKVSFEF
jgi:acyl-ACP thioesterase